MRPFHNPGRSAGSIVSGMNRRTGVGSPEMALKTKADEELEREIALVNKSRGRRKHWARISCR